MDPSRSVPRTSRFISAACPKPQVAYTLMLTGVLPASYLGSPSRNAHLCFRSFPFPLPMDSLPLCLLPFSISHCFKISTVSTPVLKLKGSDYFHQIWCARCDHVPCNLSPVSFRLSRAIGCHLLLLAYCLSPSYGGAPRAAI